jgi:hypothetical protein
MLALFLALFLLCDPVWSQEPPQTPKAEAQKQPESGLKPQEKNQEQTQPAKQLSPAAPQIGAERAEGKRQGESRERSEQGTEFWPALRGYRLKVTDTLLVAVTFFLFLSTVALWLSTRKLVKTSEITAQRQLRAYISVEKAEIMSALPTGQIAQPGMIISAHHRPASIIRFRNFGQTPARNVTFKNFGIGIVAWPFDATKLPVSNVAGGSRASIAPTAPRDKYDIPHEDLPLLTIEDIAGLQNGSLAIVVHGEVHYADIFKNGWVTKYRYFIGGPVGLRGLSLSAHDEGNDET